MIALLDSDVARGLGYVVVGLVALVWWLRERGRARLDQPLWWPAYWLVTGLVLLAMAAVVGGSLGEWVAALGRDAATDGGWYARRRAVQAVAVLGIGVGWVLVVLLAVWRVPPRRRRYLPHALGVSALLAFAAVRGISLHHVDTVLYRTTIGPLRVVAVVELALLAATLLAGVVVARVPPRPPAAAGAPAPSRVSAP